MDSKSLILDMAASEPVVSSIVSEPKRIGERQKETGQREGKEREGQIKGRGRKERKGRREGGKGDGMEGMWKGGGGRMGGHTCVLVRGKAGKRKMDVGGRYGGKEGEMERRRGNLRMDE